MRESIVRSFKRWRLHTTNAVFKKKRIWLRRKLNSLSNGLNQWRIFQVVKSLQKQPKF